MSERIRNIRRYIRDMDLRKIQARANHDRDHGIHPELETKEQLAERAIEAADDRAYLLFEISQLRDEQYRGASTWEVIAAMVATGIGLIAMPYIVSWITSLW